MRNSDKSAFEIDCENVIINNLTIIGAKNAFLFNYDGNVTNCNFINNTESGSRGGGSAIHFYNRGIVTNCTFTGNTAETMAGGAIYFNEKGIVTNCTFTDNTAKGIDGGAIYFNNGGIVTNCTFTGNTADKNGGAIVYYQGKYNVTNCAFVNNNAQTDSAIYSEGALILNFDYNWWGSNNPNWNNLIGDASGQTYVPSVYVVLNLTADPSEISIGGKSNIITKFVWNGTDTDATSLLPKRNVKLSSNGGSLSKTEGDVGFTSKFTADSPGNYNINATVDSQTLTVPVHVTSPWYVNGSAPSGGNGSEAKPFNTLKDALAVAQDGNTIIIAPGEYKGTHNIDLTIDKKLNFIKYGNGEVIFDAEGLSRIWTVTAKSININGLTFKNGKAHGHTFNDGSAIYFTNELSNFNINATFINNTATENCYGGAIHIEGDASGNLNGTFINNTASMDGGAVYIGSSASGNLTGIFINNKATGNDSSGGAILILSSVLGNLNGIFINNTANSGGAIEVGLRISGNLNGIFINNTATGNESSGGAINILETITGNLNGIFINNTAYNGGAIYSSFLDGDLRGTFINNKATNKGDAIHSIAVASSDFVIRDSIFINNNSIYVNLEGNFITAINCWFGNNATNHNTKPTPGNVTIDNWLFLNATANPTEINVGDTSAITFKLESYNETSKDISPYDASKMNVIIELSQTLGQLNQTIALIGEEVIYTAKQVGNASVTGKVGTSFYTVNLKNNDSERTPTNITVNTTSLNLTVDETGTIGATLNPPEAGNPTFTSNDTNIATVDVNGVVTAVSEGSAIITVSFAGNEQYAPADNKTVSVTVSDKPTPKKDLNISATAEPITVGENATVIVSGFVSDHGSHATGTVTVIAAGKTFNGTIKSFMLGGYIAEFIVTGLNETTIANVNYLGDDKFNPANTTVKIIVNPKSDIVIVAENVTKYYHGPERFVANIYGPEGNPLVNKSVNITINGVTYTRTTDDNGTVSMTINLGSGTYDVTTKVDNTTLKSSVTVLSTVIGSDITKYYKNKTQYSVQVFDTNGKVVSKGEVVTFNINGIFYNRTTDENGIATLNINLPPSDYIVTADYKGCRIANNITVLPVLNATDITMKYMDGTQFKVNLVDGQGNPYKDQFVRFNINGKFYDRLTDSNGQAKLNIRLPAGEYIITSSFNGANIANKITITG